MEIPENIMSDFINEVEKIKYGRVSLGYVKRGSHSHYEVDKHVTYMQDDDNEVKVKQSDVVIF